MVRPKPRRNHHHIVGASEDKHAASHCAVGGASANRSARSSKMKPIFKDGGNRCKRKPRARFAKPFDVSLNHDQATHGDVILGVTGNLMSAELATGRSTANFVVCCTEAAANSDNHHASETSRPLAIQYACYQNPHQVTYLLAGFDCSFLDMRRVSFMEPLPTACVCVICCVLPAKIMPLPCGHAVCLACWYNPYDSADKPHQDSKALSMFRSGVCPMDGVPFADPELEVVTCPKGVYNKPVFCVNNVFGCRFIVELGHLKAHCLHECRFHPMTCLLCGRDDIPECMTEQHFLLCARWYRVVPPTHE
ncbi:hypothetical protein HPB49_015669 [Dermacentor silvarum]|uniref:Uncharacterized protein n=1 Tax=Dermacentor silvarum TaxID=543639 RepID=A0ACB8DQ19_DERSI|nr:hypothetical protein HPB49_015669 [Dermacentor silvarum]